jgi:hypothetical protein
LNTTPPASQAFAETINLASLVVSEVGAVEMLDPVVEALDEDLLLDHADQEKTVVRFTLASATEKSAINTIAEENVPEHDAAVAQAQGAAPPPPLAPRPCFRRCTEALRSCDFGQHRPHWRHSVIRHSITRGTNDRCKPSPSEGDGFRPCLIGVVYQTSVRDFGPGLVAMPLGENTPGCILSSGLCMIRSSRRGRDKQETGCGRQKSPCVVATLSRGELA